MVAAANETIENALDSSHLDKPLHSLSDFLRLPGVGRLPASGFIPGHFQDASACVMLWLMHVEGLLTQCTSMQCTLLKSMLPSKLHTCSLLEPNLEPSAVVYEIQT